MIVRLSATQMSSFADIAPVRLIASKSLVRKTFGSGSYRLHTCLGVTTEAECLALKEVCMDSLGNLETLSQVTSASESSCFKALIESDITQQKQCEADYHCSQHCPGESCQSVFNNDICISAESQETCTGTWNTEKVLI